MCQQTAIIAFAEGQILCTQVTEIQSDEPVSLGRQPTAQQTAIIAFAARYHSNLPFQDAQPTMLKEYLPGARSLGCNELQLLNHLCTMPSQKWKAAYAALSANPPIVPLLGMCITCHCTFAKYVPCLEWVAVSCNC